MANRRQIPFLHWQRNADGSETAWWKPSPRLRKLGWKNRKLGTRAHEDDVVLAAMALNRQLAEWEGAAPTLARPTPKVWTFADLVHAYETSTDFTDDIKDSTRREYRVRLRQLEEWARDARGQSIPVQLLDMQMVQDLKTALLRGSSRFKTASVLRVLRLLLNWAKARPAIGITHNATEGVKIPGTDSRQQKFAWHQAQLVAAAAEELGYPITARAIRIGFWTLQRESDLVALTRLKWRTLENLDARDRPALVDSRGDVKGFRLRQEKTGAWIDAPLPPFLHGEIETAFAAGQYVLPDPLDPEKPMPQWKLQRQVRAALVKTGFTDHQFRDLRRSGMSFFKDHGALQSNVFAISGHPVMGGKRTIADTYMPPDTAAACAAVAAVLRTLARIEKREKSNG